MRLIQINSVYEHGSTGKIAQSIHEEMLKEGHESWVFYGRGRQSNDARCSCFNDKPHVYLDAALTRITGNVGAFSISATQKLIERIDGIRPDIIHIHNLHGYYINIKNLLSYFATKNIRTIFTLHDEFLYTGKCGYSYACEQWRTGCGHCPLLHDYPKSILWDKTASMYTNKKKLTSIIENMTIVTPSRWLADRVKDSFLGQRKIRVVHNGVDSARIFRNRDTCSLRQKLGLGNEKVVLALAPDLMNKRKGGTYVLRLASRMQAHNIKFILVGVVGELHTRYENIIVKNEISNQQELAEYYSLADVFIICSERETFSMTCAEALCCGTPVVGFKCGAPETIFETPYAEFVEYGDVSALAQLVATKLDGKKDAVGCSLYAKNNFSIETMLSNYKTLYNEVLNS